MPRKRKASTNLAGKMKKTATKSKGTDGGEVSGYREHTVTPVGKRGKTPIGRRK